MDNLSVKIAKSILIHINDNPNVTVEDLPKLTGFSKKKINEILHGTF